MGRRRISTVLVCLLLILLLLSAITNEIRASYRALSYASAKNQQKKTSRLNGIKKGEWEKKRIQESKETNGKSMWPIIKEVLGKTKSNKDQVFVYRDNNTRHRIKDEW